jgi:diacylglycerol kinase (ATP)
MASWKISMDEKWAFIVNPIAGNRHGSQVASELKKQCDKRSLNYDISFTEKKYHAAQLSSDYAARGYRYIIAVGGDGTVNEAAGPLVENNDVIFGIIPAGTGNDLIQITGFAGYFTDRDWDTFFLCNTTKMDAGYCNGHYFFNGMGLGYDAQVAAENYSEDPSHKVKLGSKYKYIWHIIKTLLIYKAKKMVTMVGESSLETTCFINTISIGRRFAGSFFLTPKAYADDGLLDICNVQEVTFPDRIRVFLQVPSGKHIGMEPVNYYQTDKLSVSFSERVPYHLDGELFFDSHFDILSIPKALNIIYNKTGNHYFKYAK